jgi:hypothetical protein
MKGFYVYCICRGADEKKIRIGGVEFGGKILVIPFKDIEAVVSDIDLSQFNEEKIKDKLQEDQKWTEKNIRCHHDVVAKVYEIDTVIPMKFGTIFKTKKSLEAMLKKYYRKFKELLTELSGKQEWGVKGYLEYKKFAEILKNKNKEIQKLEKKRSSVPEGMKWYMERKADELIAGRIECEVEDELQKIIKKLEKYAKEIRFNDLLPKEIGEPAKDMILNAACLVRNDALDKFQAMFQGLLRECESLGIILTLTGPWPPYNFVDIKK